MCNCVRICLCVPACVNAGLHARGRAGWQEVGKRAGGQEVMNGWAHVPVCAHTCACAIVRLCICSSVLGLMNLQLLARPPHLVGGVCKLGQQMLELDVMARGRRIQGVELQDLKQLKKGHGWWSTWDGVKRGIGASSAIAQYGAHLRASRWDIVLYAVGDVYQRWRLQKAKSA